MLNPINTVSRTTGGLILAVFLIVLTACQGAPVRRDQAYQEQYPKVAPEAHILYHLESNQQRTTFLVDGQKIATGRRIKILLDERPHTITAEPEGYHPKEEFIQPPYMENGILSFTFMLGERLASAGAAQAPAPAQNIPAAAPAPAATASGMINNGFAVIIGISSYKYADGKHLTNLAFADNDARAFSLMLQKQGWPAGNIKMLINEQATLREIQIALDSWLTKAGPQDLILLYWSGHGFPSPEDPTKVYFACYDTDIRIPATGYRMDHVRRSLEEKNARNVLLLADTCHAGKLVTRGDKGVSIMPQVKQMESQQNIPKGWIFMVGADSDRQAIEHTSWSNGAFTKCLLDAMGGKADGFMSTGARDGRVTLGELRAYLNKEMPEETQKVLGEAKFPLITTSSGDPEIWNLSFGGTKRADQ